MEDNACHAADASAAEPGSGNGRASQPTEHELLSALLEATHILVNNQAVLMDALTQLMRQNEQLIASLVDAAVDESPEPQNYLSGAPIRG